MSQIPDFDLLAIDGTRLRRDALLGTSYVLYFYPKADTSGCTREAQDFTCLAPDFAALNMRVIGVSRDPITALAKFAEKYALGITLASDDNQVCEAFGTWVEKSMYGRKYMGIDRASFLINARGEIVQEWRKVKVPGHAAEVLKAAQQLDKA